MTFLTAIFVLALTRAEILERMRAPVVTHADGFVQVYADCPEDMRREYQAPVGRFVAETVGNLYRGLGKRPEPFRRPPLIIHIGDVRTNVSEVVARVSTNDARIVTRLYLKSPGYADLDRLRTEISKAFFRSVERREVTAEDALAIYRRADPKLRVADERRKLEDWLKGEGKLGDEQAITLMRKIIEPGVASRRDVLTFASRLYFYPPYRDQPFVGGVDCVSFREAIDFARIDMRVRFLAFQKANEIPVWGGGRGDALQTAAKSYEIFLRELGKGEESVEEMGKLLDKADAELRQAMEVAE